VWVSKPWSYSSTCNNLREQHPLGSKYGFPKKVDLGWVEMRLLNFFVGGPEFTDFYSSKVRGILVDHLLFQFVISLSVPEIIEIKV